MWLWQELSLCTTEICLNRDLKIKTSVIRGIILPLVNRNTSNKKTPDFSEVFCLSSGSIQLSNQFFEDYCKIVCVSNVAPLSVYF